MNRVLAAPDAPLNSGHEDASIALMAHPARCRLVTGHRIFCSQPYLKVNAEHMIDDGKTVRLSRGEYEDLLDKTVESITDMTPVPRPWIGPRAVHIELDYPGLLSAMEDAAQVAHKADFDRARDVFIAGLFGIGGTLLGWILAKIF